MGGAGGCRDALKKIEDCVNSNTLGMDIFGRESPARCATSGVAGDTRGALKKNGDIDLVSRFAVYGGISGCLFYY